MSNTVTTNQTTTIPRWDGKKETAETFMYKFKAACTLKMVDGEPCHKVLREEFEAQLPTDENVVLDETDPDDAKKILALKQNEQVMAMLMIAMHTKEGMSKVMQEMNRNPIFQTGQAWRIIKSIRDECRPDDHISEMELEAEVNKIKLKKGEDPNVLLEKLADIEVRFGMNIDNKKKSGVVLRCGKGTYNAVMATTTVNKKKSSKGHPTAEELIEDMHTQWRISSNTSGGKDALEDDDVKETTLVSKDTEEEEDNGKTEPASKDNRTCYKCGDIGHIARDCPSKKGSDKLVVICNHCNKPGHKQDDCWELHPEKKPGYVEKSGSSIEILVASVEGRWDTDELVYPSPSREERLYNSVDSGDLNMFDLSLDGQDGLCKKEEEGLYNLVDAEGLVVETERLENSDELEDRDSDTKREKRLCNLVDSKDLAVYKMDSHGFGTEDKEDMYDSSRGYGAKNEDEKYVDSRGYDIKYEDEKIVDGSHGYDTKYAAEDIVYDRSHGFDTTEKKVVEVQGNRIAVEAIEHKMCTTFEIENEGTTEAWIGSDTELKVQDMLKAEDTTANEEKIEMDQKYLGEEVDTLDIQSKEGVRSNQKDTLKDTLFSKRRCRLAMSVGAEQSCVGVCGYEGQNE